MKTFKEYAEAAEKTNTRPSPEYPFFGLSEEVGEVMGKISKRMRHNQMRSCFVLEALSRASKQGDSYPEFKDLYQTREDIIKELGDVLWYLNACCVELNVTLEEVAQQNIEKTHGRLERGTIVGEGDER